MAINCRDATVVVAPVFIHILYVFITFIAIHQLELELPLMLLQDPQQIPQMLIHKT